MNASDERTRSLWMDVSVADVPQLRKNVTADTVIVGSGIAGLSTAYELALKGQKVVVLDRGRIAGGMTWNGTECARDSGALLGALWQRGRKGES